MNILKKILFIFIVTVVLLMIVAFFLPARYSVSRKQVIEVSVDRVFMVLVDMTRRSEWDPWIEKDPEADIQVGGSRQGVGAWYAWESEKIGTGNLTIQEIEENRRIQSRLVFESPQESSAVITWVLNGNENQTQVMWKIEGSLQYPAERFLGLMMGRMIGPDFERGLLNLKSLVEDKHS